MHQAVIGIASDVMEAEKLVESLKNVGFTIDDISVLLPDQFGAQELGYEKHNKAPEGISTGVGSGALLGGALGYFAGSGLVWIPGLAPFIAAGPIIAALSIAAVGGAVGGLSGGLIGLGIPEYEAKKYERKIRFGSTLIAVHVETLKEARIAEETFRKAGLADIQRTGEDAIKKTKSMSASASK